MSYPGFGCLPPYRGLLGVMAFESRTRVLRFPVDQLCDVRICGGDEPVAGRIQKLDVHIGRVVLEHKVVLSNDLSCFSCLENGLHNLNIMPVFAGFSRGVLNRNEDALSRAHVSIYGAKRILVDLDACDVSISMRKDKGVA